MIALPRCTFTTTSGSVSAFRERQSHGGASPFGRVSNSQLGGRVRVAAVSERRREQRGVMEDKVGTANGVSEALAAKMAEMALKKQESPPQKPLFSFGVITDIQYADIDDGRSFLGVPRYYRHALVGLRRAVEAWNQKGDLAFAIHFGDIVDGWCPKDQSRAAFERVIGELENFKGGRVYHMVGNHCLYNLPRQELNEIFGIPTTKEGQQSYYSFSPNPGFLFVVLDGYDVSALGWPEDHPHTKAAMEILNTRNPNEEKNSPDGLVGVERRFVKFNGGVGEEQLAWLEKTLQEATDAKQKVVICCHLPLDPGAAFPSTLLWNYDVLMEVVHKFNCVVACLGGHAHEGGHSVDSHGVHHHVLEAVLECPPGTDSYGYIAVYPDHLSLCGTDRMASTDMFFL
ncbi:hypothetical protein M758_10G075900 [Ceratodon purpureus]|nr:hypothetical protein M758_10G075900 [Ceratodon purpureus]